MNYIEYIVLSLEKSERLAIINKNIKILPQLKIFRSINGYNTNETLFALKKSGLKLVNLDTWHYGTLANFLTKYFCLLHQISNNIEYMCFLEDDVLIDKAFPQFVENLVSFKNHNLNQVRIGNWGEGYITSLAGAKRIVNIIKKKGINFSIDNQLRLLCNPEYDDHLNTPWTLLSPPNQGDCLKTKKIIRKMKNASTGVDFILSTDFSYKKHNLLSKISAN